MVVGNWKMNGDKAQAGALISGAITSQAETEAVDIVLCPPFVLIQQVISGCSGSKVAVGGQNLNLNTSGAHTGEISGSMLSDQGCRYVIVGHSERRSLYGDTDTIVGKKAALADSFGLRPIICVGETQFERERGATNSVVERQVQTIFDEAGPGIFPNAILAYEPVWAIGTGQTATPDQAQEVHGLIRKLIKQYSSSLAENTLLLYGGSVKADNARDLFVMGDIDGGLIGGASLNPDDFREICRATQV
tara:strand:+ start:103 stop:846 length:744 start_codon:yes stop_codon:yes gene_type:complete